MLYIAEIRKKEFKYNIKNPININIKKLFTFLKKFFLPPPKNLKSPPQKFF